MHDPLPTSRAHGRLFFTKVIARFLPNTQFYPYSIKKYPLREGGRSEGRGIVFYENKNDAVFLVVFIFFACMLHILKFYAACVQ